MQIVLKVWSSDSERGLGFDYAIIRCTGALLTRSLRRLNAFRKGKSADPSIKEWRYWDASAEYFDLWVDLVSEREPACLSDELARAIDALEVDKREAVLASSDLKVPEEYIGAVDCAMVVVCNDGISFTALLKKDDVRLTTAEIPAGLLESALAALK